MSILNFPHSQASAASGYPTVGLPFIMRELGQRNLGLNRQLAYVTRLIEECAFPPPYPALIGKKDAQQLTRDVVKHSAWSRLAVVVWLEDYLPQTTAAALDERAARSAADEMDAAAGGLKLAARTEA